MLSILAPIFAFSTVFYLFPHPNTLLYSYYYHIICFDVVAISLSWTQVVNFWSIVSQKWPLTPKYIHNSSALEYIYSLYHKESQYIAKLRQITIEPYKSHLVTIETPRNHTLSQHQIVFSFVENYVGIVMNFLISKKRLSFQSTLKLHKNHNLNHFVPTHTLLRRLCPWPPDPNTVEKLRLSAFCMCN